MFISILPEPSDAEETSEKKVSSEVNNMSLSLFYCGKQMQLIIELLYL